MNDRNAFPHGQTAHGPGHLGDTKVGDDKNRNGVAERED